MWRNARIYTRKVLTRRGVPRVTVAAAASVGVRRRWVNVVSGLEEPGVFQLAVVGSTE